MADSIGNIYGNALFEVCCEENCLDEVYGELGSIRDILFSPVSYTHLTLPTKA